MKHARQFSFGRLVLACTVVLGVWSQTGYGAAPQITGISPTGADGKPLLHPGGKFTIMGQNFSAQPAENKISIHPKTVLKSPLTGPAKQPGVVISPKAAGASRLDAIVPSNLAAGSYLVSVTTEGGGQSAAVAVSVGPAKSTEKPPATMSSAESGQTAVTTGPTTTVKPAATTAKPKPAGSLTAARLKVPLGLKTVVKARPQKPAFQHAPTFNPTLEGFIEPLPKVEVVQDADGPTGPDKHSVGKLGDATCDIAEQPWHTSCSFEQIVALNPNTAALWPGCIVRGEPLASGLLVPINLPRRPGKITVNGLSFTDPSASYSQEVAPDQGTVTTLLQKLMHQPISGTVANLTSDEDQFYSLSDACLKIGVKADWLTGKAKGDLEDKSYSECNNLVVSLTQVYATFDFEYPGNAAAFFDPSIKLDDARRQVGSTAPAYVSSVSYGRLMYMFISSENSIDEIKAAVSAECDYGVVSGSVNVDSKSKEVMKHSHATVLAIGGPSSGAVSLVEAGNGNGDGLVKYLRAGQDCSPQSPGAPISYQVRYLIDDMPARLSFVTDYTAKTYTPLQIKGIMLSIHTEDDDKDDSEGVTFQVWNGAIKIADSGVQGRGQTWEDQDANHNRQPRNFGLGFNTTVPINSKDLKLRIIKQEDGGDGGNGWHLSISAMAWPTISGCPNQEILARDKLGTIQLGNGRPAYFETHLPPTGQDVANKTKHNQP